MIRFSLICGAEHEFEAWFKSSASFDEQAAKGVLECPVCGSLSVRKAIMAPAVARTDRERRPAAREVAVTSPPSAPTPGPSLTPEQTGQLLRFFRAVHRHVEANFDNVGERFPEEARKIHYGETEQRGIFGQANEQEVKALVDEGIEVGVLPHLPDLDS